MAGRRPTPTALKMLRGTARPDRINREEPTPALAEARPPRGMTPGARRYWRSLAPLLIRIRVLTEGDCLLLKDLCEALEDRDTFRADWTKNGAWYETANKLGEFCIKRRPSWEMFHATQQRILRMLGEFGLTPSSRSRIKAQPAEEIDPFEEFLGNAN